MEGIAIGLFLALVVIATYNQIKQFERWVNLWLSVGIGIASAYAHCEQQRQDMRRLQDAQARVQREQENYEQQAREARR